MPFAVELAKVTLMLGKKLALDEAHNVLPTGQANLPLEMESALPLDNLDANIRCDDALFCKWPEAEAIIGNPPYQSKNKMQREYGADYVQVASRALPRRAWPSRLLRVLVPPRSRRALDRWTRWARGHKYYPSKLLP